MQKQVSLHNTDLVHYGSTEFDQDRFVPVTNYWVKPKGGLWCCPLGSKWGWLQWCTSNEFFVTDFSKSFQLKLKATATIFVVDSVGDMLTMPVVRTNNPILRNTVDFEKMVQAGIDCIWLTERGQSATHLCRYAHGRDLYGWDCESVLIMNPNCIIV